MTSEAVRLRLLFDDRYILSKSKKKEGLKRCWFLLKPHLNTISDLTSHLQNAFRLHRTCPDGITLSMDGFVLPSFESTCILKDKDIVCVKRKGSVSTDRKPAILPSENNGNLSIELQELLQIEGFQEEKAGYESVSIDDDDDGQSEGVVYVESKSDGNAKSKKTKASKKLKSPRQHFLSQEERRVHEIVSQVDDSDQPEEVAYVEPKSDGNAASKKRKASKKLKSPSQKKIKMSTAENLPVISEVDNEENESSKGRAHHCLSLVKKDINELSNLSNQLNKSSNPDSIKQKNDKSGPTSDDTRFLQPQDEGETKKLPSRSARRKKAKRRWLRELKLEKEKKEKEEKEEVKEKGKEKLHPSPVVEKDDQQEVKEKGKEKLHPSPVVEKDDQQLPIKDNCVVSDVDQQSDEESGAEEDMVPVEIRPGHIRFQSRGKDQAVPQNQFSAETFQWNGITSKKKGQKWGKERTSSHKHDDYEQSNQDSPTIQNTEKKNTSDAVDFEKLTPYKGLPKEGDIIAYRLIELSASWTPELSSFRAGRVSRYDGKSNMIQLEPVSDFPFDFVKKIDEDTSPVQSDPSPYQEDGSLEIEYVSLADVRIIKHGHSDLATVVASSSAWVTPTKATNSSNNEKLAGVQSAWGSWKPEKEGHTPAKHAGVQTARGSWKPEKEGHTPAKLAGVQTAWGSWKPEKEGHTPAKLAGVQTAWGSWKPEKEGHTPAKENGEVNVWDEINEALKAKKAKLSQNDGWRIEESPGSRSWSKRAMRCSAMGPTMSRLRLQNGL